jgi:hypothetical protein
MKTEIILDDKSLARLMKDPDVAVRIKDEAVGTVAAKVAETVLPEVEKRIKADVDNMIKSVLHADVGTMFYPNRDESVVRLAQMARDEIKKAVNSAILQNVGNEVYARINEQTDRLRKRVDEIMKTIGKERLQEVVTCAARHIVEDAMRRGFGCEA